MSYVGFLPPFFPFAFESDQSEIGLARRKGSVTQSCIFKMTSFHGYFINK